MADVRIVLDRDKEIRGKEFKQGHVLCTCNMEREINPNDLMKAILLREVGVVEDKKAIETISEPRDIEKKKDKK